MKVNEIFDSLQGEQDGFGGQGKPTTFIRLQGCNLPTPCSYCDTAIAFHAAHGKEMSISEITQRVNMPKVTITGGEPLAQYNDVMELVRRLLVRDIPTTIETNGSILVPETLPCFPYRSARAVLLRIVMDYKLPSSGMERYMDMEAFNLLHVQDVIKFVISDGIDYKRMKVLLAEKNWQAQIVVSPMLTNAGLDTSQGYEHASKLASIMLNDPDMHNVQFNLQLHKLLGVK